MKLFLTSTGLTSKKILHSFQRMLAPRLLRDLSFLVISIQDNDQDANFLKKTLSELKEAGVRDIRVLPLTYKTPRPRKKYDVIYVCGGNTFDYLDRVMKNNLDSYIVPAVKSGRSWYVGVSAGSILAGPEISLAGWGDHGDDNNIGLDELEGLALTDIIIFPHYQPEDINILNDFSKISRYRVIELTDDQAVYLEYSGGSPENGSAREILF